MAGVVIVGVVVGVVVVELVVVGRAELGGTGAVVGVGATRASTVTDPNPSPPAGSPATYANVPVEPSRRTRIMPSLPNQAFVFVPDMTLSTDTPAGGAAC